jgi:carbon storage regulator CsrA
LRSYEQGSSGHTQQWRNMMLVLTRKKNETIIIGDIIKVTLLEADKGKARIGIEAPMEVNIRRSELVKKCTDT